MRRILLPVLALLLLGLSIAGVTAVLGQGDSPSDPAFTRIQQFGKLRPQGIQYDPNFDQTVMVDTDGRLVLADAATFTTHFVLYERGSYSTYTFSHDGRWLALGIERRVELWDTRSGELAASVEPEEALAIQDPLQFAADDSLLMINALVPAPAALRRSENDTSSLPYLWDLPAARDEARTTLPRNLELYTFYDYRDALIVGPHHKIIGAVSGRLQVVDVADPNLPLLTEIDSTRHAPDPVSVWISAQDDLLYVRPLGRNVLVQINTATGATFDIPVGQTINYQRQAEIEPLLLSNQARIIGDPVTRQDNAFLRLLFGDNYRASTGYHPLTMILLDIMQPVTEAAEDTGLLVYAFDEESGAGSIDALRLPDVINLALHPDGTHLLVRRASNGQPIEVYNMTTGALELTIFPAIPDPNGQHILAYNGTGDVILSDFQRFDARTGEVLYEDLHYRPALGNFYFSADSRRMVTITNSDEWWVWDIATGDVIRRERIALRGPIIEQSADANRFLTVLDDGRGREIVDIGTGTRQSIYFDVPPGRTLGEVIPSPDWQHFLVIYPPYPYSQHYPGDEIALYSWENGQEWFMAGADLLPPNGRLQGWMDNETLYFYTEAQDGAAAPDRIYGLDIHGSGLPTCIVERFPDQWPQWAELWERFTARLAPDDLGRLAAELCAVNPTTADDVDAVFFPTPTATRPPRTPQAAVIAGVPSCLTQRFSSEALDYAAIWRELSAGMTEEEAANLESMLCEGLGVSSPVSSGRPSFDSGVSGPQVMTINIHTGKRTSGWYIPPRPTELQRSRELVLAAFQKAEGYSPGYALLSPDGTLLAVETNYGYIEIYRLDTPYSTLADNATATAAPRVVETAVYLAVRPTATQGFDTLGGPRPTLTPTITPTPPPPAAQEFDLAERDAVEEVCPGMELADLYTIDAPPADYTPSGQVIVKIDSSPGLWRLDPATGALHPDERLPRCDSGVSCQYSFDQEWMIVLGDTIEIARPDGSAATVLFEEREQSAWPETVYWRDNNTVEFRYQGYLPEESRNSLTLLRHVDPVTGDISEPQRTRSTFGINGLDTEVVASQPNGGALAVVRTQFNTGYNTGYKYYIVNYDTGDIDYFARLAEYSANELTVTWHPLGTALYYHYPQSSEWLIYNPATGEHRVFGELPDGTWSRDGRYRVSWITLPLDEVEARKEAELPLPKLSVWDSTTGLTRRYCIPGTGERFPDVSLDWSPDNRYLIFNLDLPADDEERIGTRTLVLDTHTGSVTALTEEVTTLYVWYKDAP